MESYIPDKLPPNNIDWESHVSLIGKAGNALGQFRGSLRNVVNPSIFLSPLSLREAVVSSRIEGSQATMNQVLEFEVMPQKDLTPERQDDFLEVLNYREALIKAEEELRRLPLSLRLVCNAHRRLLSSVRGKNKTPGEFRRGQNYIAPYGQPQENATFVPPSPSMMREALNSWENYLHVEEKDPLVHLAVIKAQFELIHPFMDGNGRIGRLLVPLILFDKKLLSGPHFYLSAYLERNRDEYFARLGAISKDGDWNGWIQFFLRAIIEQATENTNRILAILELYNDMKVMVSKATKSHYAIQALDAIFNFPFFQTVTFIRSSGIPRESAAKLLRRLCDKGIIQQILEGRGSRSAVYQFSRLIELTEV